MEVTSERFGLREACESSRMEGNLIGFVPTMGALHDGHLSLLARAREECDTVVASIFVNPLQFGPAEDLATYPRDLERDLLLLEKEGVDIAFTPDAEEMYPRGRPDTAVEPGSLGERFEGASRPGHFRGVCTVVAKLFGLVGESRAYFGEKDAQQLAVIRRMVSDLDMPVEVVACPTLREEDGLAMSSRNARLSEDERAAATCLYESLARAAWLVEGGERDANVLKAEMAKRIGAEPLAQLDYVAIVEDDTFSESDRLERPSRALVAAHVGQTRLIDNLPLPVDDDLAEG